MLTVAEVVNGADEDREEGEEEEGEEGEEGLSRHVVFRVSEVSVFPWPVPDLEFESI